MSVETNPSEWLSAALLRGEIDDAILKEIASLGAWDVDPSLEQAMLMTLEDTEDGRVRNLLALALARIQTDEAIPRIMALLKDPKTFGYRGTLIYALQNLT